MIRNLLRRPSLLLLGLLAPLAATAATTRLLDPADSMEMTDIASYFRWTPVEGCDTFDLQIASDPDFAKPVRERRTVNKGYHKNLYFPKDVLPPGTYFWRVRPAPGGQPEAWTAPAKFTVNGDHSVSPKLVREIGPDAPLFLMRNRNWDPGKNSGNIASIIPPGLERVIVVDDIAMAGEKVAERAEAYQRLGLDFVLWNNRCQVPLSTLELIFQKHSHCLGTAEGEHFGGMYWEKGPEGNLSETDYVHRAWSLCAKYGRSYFFSDGDAGQYRWPNFTVRERENLAAYGRNLVPMFKTTNADVALFSYGAVEGLLASGTVRNTGIWVDEWVWPCAGFGKLGEIIPDDQVSANRRKVGTRDCPWVYDIQMWLMGIASGSTVFHLESAHQWTSEGKPAAHYSRVLLPFVKAVQEHKLLPSRQALLDSITVAVELDPALASGKHNKRYSGSFAFLNDLYGIKDHGDRELIPNKSRHGIVCFLPPGTSALNPSTKVLRQAELSDPATAVALFERHQPSRFTGEAFQWECDGTIIATNTAENTACVQTFDMPLPRGVVKRISGSLATHQYLIAKIAPDGRSFWLQANGEDPAGEVTIAFEGADESGFKVTPEAAFAGAKRNGRGPLFLTLSFKNGAAEVVLK